MVQYFGVELIHSVFGKSGPESRESGVIRGGLAQWQAEELFKRQAVVDLIFKFGVGVDAETLLKHQAFEEQKRRIGVGAFTAGTDRVVVHQDGIDSGPVDGIGDFFHELEAAVVSEGTGESKIGES